ncbi:MAG: protein kinase [Acidobacteria bacterium]|jgi:serine/threonine protein kinase|nr:protein kinase [Acidobacteriota bacterium]
MNRNEWQKVKKIFDAALKLAPDERGKFLDENCDENKTLRREVENLLASFNDDSFMEQPAATELASLIVERNSKLTDGEQIAHYQILSQIGAGGMGEVYLAKDTRLHRKIALKILPAALSNDQDRLRRFEQEACAASALNHPNILTIYEIGETAKTRYIATEFIEGETLRDKLERDEMNLKEILDIAGQTAFALSAAHAAGIVHRDIKPENIMLRADGIVKVLDFGLAKLTGKKGIDSDAEAETFAQVNTQAGMILGTVAYMSPEQARGKETDARTDIWSLGVVLYEMLAGKVPFAGETMSDTIAAILKSEPAPTGENTPPELNRIMRKALQKNADERYQTVRDLLLDLKNLKRQLEFSEEPERSHIPSFAKLADVGTAQSDENATAIQPAAVSTRNNVTQQPSSVEYVVGEVRRYKFVSLGLLAALVVALAAIGYFRFFATHSAVINSIAVLPFVNESGNSDAEYLSDGMTETLISSLSQLSRLSVKARSSVKVFIIGTSEHLKTSVRVFCFSNRQLKKTRHTRRLTLAWL